MKKRDYKGHPGVVFKGESRTEQTGYQSVQQQVARFQHAGAILTAARMSQGYEYPDGNVRDALPDPSRSGNFDLVDADRLRAGATKRLEAAAQAAADSKKADIAAKQAADDESRAEAIVKARMSQQSGAKSA